MGLFSSPKTVKTTDSRETTNMRGGSEQNSSFEQSNQQTSTGHTTASQTGLTTTNPNNPEWYNTLMQQIGGGFGHLFNSIPNANKPLYGPQQEAQFRESTGQQYRQASQDLSQVLASTGALNSGRAAQAQTGLAIGQANQIGDYLAKVPLLNAQNQQNLFQQQLGALNAAGGFKPNFGTTTQTDQQSIQDVLSQLFGSASGSSNTTATQWQDVLKQLNSTETTQQQGGLFSGILGGLLSSFLGPLGGVLGGIIPKIFGGSGGGSGTGLAYGNHD